MGRLTRCNHLPIEAQLVCNQVGARFACFSSRSSIFWSMVMSTQWGLCKDCKWWQIEPGASAQNNTMGLCIDEDLQPYQLRVSGNSGCNRFMEGAPAHAAGSSEQPPTAKPVR
jgi:hypothetical protein